MAMKMASGGYPHVHGQVIDLPGLPGVVLRVTAPDDLDQPPQRDGYAQGRRRQHHGVDSPLPKPTVYGHV